MDDLMEQWLTPGWSRPLSRKTNLHDVTCSRCGTTRLKWRIEDGTWRLFEDKRGDHNEKLLHQCAAVTETDFEVLDGN